MSKLIELAILPSPCSLFSVQTQANDYSSQIENDYLHVSY